MTYAYVRVSTGKQTCENQRHEIERFCRENNLTIAQWVEETISGTKEIGSRRLGRLAKKLRPGDYLICTELSRLGRSLYMIMAFLQKCMESGCNLWTVKDGYRLGNDIQSKVLAFAFGLSAEIERNLISLRTREALSRLRNQGVRLGRPEGAKNHRYKLDSMQADIDRMLRDRLPKARIARKCGVCEKTLYVWLARREKPSAE